MKGFCPMCRRFVDLVDEHCPTCGPADAEVEIAGLFLSGNDETPNVVVVSPGTLLQSRFRVAAMAGVGRFASVYRARDTFRNQDVALKVVEIGGGDQAYAQQLLHEARVSSRLRDRSHVLEIYDIHQCRHEGRELLFLTAEYADGGSLRQWLMVHRQDPARRRQLALEYAQHICRGVESIHREDIVLIDIKPENFLFVGHRLCAADFGAAFPGNGVAAPGLSSHHFDLREYSNPAYMSPEAFGACHAEEIDDRANVYSIGIMLFEMLHEKCRRPFSGTSERLSVQHRSAPVPALAGISEELAAFVAKCLAKAPEDRYQTVGELRADLERVAGEQNASLGTWESTEPVEDAVDVITPMEESWRQACAAKKAKDFNRASRLCAEVLGMAPDHSGATRMKDEIAVLFDRVQTMYDEIASGNGRRSLLQRVELGEEAARLYPDHPSGETAQAMLEDKVDRYDDCVRNGQAAVASMEWESALESFHQAAVIAGNGAAARTVERFIECVLLYRGRRPATNRGHGLGFSYRRGP